MKARRRLSSRLLLGAVAALLAGAVAGGVMLLAGIGAGEARGPRYGPDHSRQVSPATKTSVPPSTVLEAPLSERVDVIVYGSTTSGLGAVYGLSRWAERNQAALTVALVSVTDDLETPLAQGLCIEDEYEPATIGGFYRQFRDFVAGHYQAKGVWPYTRTGRLTYEPEVARRALCRIVFGQNELPGDLARVGPVTVKRVKGHIVRAGGDQDSIWLELEKAGGQTARLEAPYAVDASVEADLARALGCRYLMGRCPKVYDDLRGPEPEAPHSKDLYAVSPQSLGYLVTLTSIVGMAAPSVRELPDWLEAEQSMGGRWAVSQDVLAKFLNSWSMRNTLPEGKHELNEPWSDWADPDVIFRWYREPQAREELAKLARHRVLVMLEQVQQRYPHIGVHWLPLWPYVRGEVMVLADRLYDMNDLTGAVQEPIATGVYAAFDRHDPVHGSLQPTDSARVRLPLAATRPWAQPRLLVSTACSLDWRAYDSACRMEPMRAAVGVACGAQVALASARRTTITEVPYADLLAELEVLGERPVR